MYEFERSSEDGETSATEGFGVVFIVLVSFSMDFRSILKRCRGQVKLQISHFAGLAVGSGHSILRVTR